MITVYDAGELVYGGAVTLAEWWDAKRISQGKLTHKEVWKKAGFWTYLAIGLIATVGPYVVGSLRRYSPWTDKMATGFIYDLPRFSKNLIDSMGTAGAYRTRGNAVQQAEELIKARQAAARALNAGTPAARSYIHEFDQVGVV